MNAKPPLGPRRFDFDLLSDNDFELLVYLVVLLEHADAIRLRAPDYGADAALPIADGSYERCWQSKRFTKQVSWPQCKGSLDAAVGAYAMPRYTFCFARDLTGPQQKLFTQHLVARHQGISVDWWGASKLTSYLLGSEQGGRIEAHFYGDPALDTEAFMRALRSGGELTTGADAVARLSEIGDFFESRDPFFTYTLTSRTPSIAGDVPTSPGAVMAVEIFTGEDRAVRIEALPRNRAALDRMPRSQLQFPNTPEGQADDTKFRRALFTGGDVTFSQVDVRFENLPAGLEAFKPREGSMELRIRAERRRPLQWDATLRVRTDRGEASIDVDLRPVDPPPEGWDSALSATSDGLTTTFLLRWLDDRGQAATEWTYKPSRGSLSGQANALALLDAAYGSGTITIEERTGGERRFAHTLDPREPNEMIGIARQLLDDLHTIENWTGEPIELPDDWTALDYDGLAEAATALRTGEMSATPRTTLRVPREELERVSDEPFEVWVMYAYGLFLFGAEHRLGFLSGGFEGRVGRSELVYENDNELIELDIVPFDESATVVFTLTRDDPQKAADPSVDVPV